MIDYIEEAFLNRIVLILENINILEEIIGIKNINIEGQMKEYMDTIMIENQKVIKIEVK